MKYLLCKAFPALHGEIEKKYLPVLDAFFKVGAIAGIIFGIIITLMVTSMLKLPAIP